MITHLDVIGVQLGAGQAVESAEVQATREDAVGAAALSASTRGIFLENIARGNNERTRYTRKMHITHIRRDLH